MSCGWPLVLDTSSTSGGSRIFKRGGHKNLGCLLSLRIHIGGQK